MKIIFLSNQLFDYPLKTNKWHVATRVAERGHRVLFIDPPIRFRKVIKQIFQGRWGLGRLLSGFYAPVGNSPKPGSGTGLRTWLLSLPIATLKVFTPLTSVPSESPNLTRFNVNRMKRRVPEFFDGEAILWVYNPAMIEYIEKIPHKLLVYDCVDDYPSMANYQRLGLSDEIAKKEEQIASRADLIFATTKNLAEKLRQRNDNVYYVGNAGDYARFAPAAKAEIITRQPASPNRGEPADKFQISNEGEERRTGEEKLPKESPVLAAQRTGFSGVPKPIIGFTGAIDDYKVNLPLLVRVAKDHPEKSLVLVGPTGVAGDQPDLCDLKGLENVYFIGERPYEEMPAFFARFDVYIIPYNLNDYTVKGCFPVKFLDALAAGLPTVVTNLPAYEDFADVSYIAGDDEEFGKLIQKALDENSKEKVEKRMRIARQNSWNNKVEKMLQIVTSKLSS
ncbi:MAG: glycosyltransferase [Patescibacteria group bacterium]|nr:glycosyltransferase [Patescibacteria group bacterium]